MATGNKEYKFIDKQADMDSPITFIFRKRRVLKDLSEAVGGKRKVFPGRERIRRVVVPEGVRILGCGLFKGCVSLESVELPESLEEIGDEVFRDCVSLHEIALPRNLKSIGKMAFFHCTGLYQCHFNDGLERVGAFAFDLSGLRFYGFPDSVRFIGSHAIGTMRGTVVIPRSLRYWGRGQHGCRGAFTRYVVPKGTLKRYQKFIKSHIEMFDGDYEILERPLPGVD